MNKTILLALLAGAPLAASLASGAGLEGYWIDSDGGDWWDAANWRDGVIPGRYVADDGVGGLVTNGTYGGTAYFGVNSWSWRWVHPAPSNGSGNYKLVSISNLVFYANDFPIVGASQWVTLPLEQGGGAYVQEACTRAPEFKCKVGLDSISDTRPLTFQNDAAGATMKFDYNFTAPRASAWVVVPYRFGGKGSIEVCGALPSYNNDRFKVDLFFTAPGKFTVNGTFENTVSVRALAGYGKQTVEILDGKSCYVDAGGIYDQACIVAQSDLEFTGAGQLVHKYTSNAANQTDMRLKVENGSTLTIATSFSSGNPNVAWVLDGEAGGRLLITGANLFTGNPVLQGGAIFETAALGTAGAASPFGLGSAVTVKGGATLRYAGAGETTDRALVLAASGTGILEQRGSGRPVFAGTVSGANTSTLVLSNDTAVAAELAGSLKGGAGVPKILKLGTGDWTLSGAALAAGEIVVEAGSLTIDDPAALDATRITVGSAGTLVLGGDEEPATRPDALTVYGTGCVRAKWANALPASGVTTPDGARVSLRLPDWSWADVLAYANAHPQTGWSSVAVDSSALADGTSFPLTNAAVTATTGFALGHEGGNTLTFDVADAVANPVTLVAREGTLRVAGAGSLNLAKALATSSTPEDVGRLVLAGPAGGVTLVDGAVEIGRAASTETVGRGEVVITNVAVAAAADKTAVAVVNVGHYGQGVLRIEAESTLAARVNVGHGTSGGSAAAEGAVHQTGGTVTAVDGVALGATGLGFYEMSGGRLVNSMAGRHLGGENGQGILHQQGGEIEFPSTMSDWAIQLGMYGGLCVYQTGGTMSFQKRTYLGCSGSGSTLYSTYFTLDGADAFTWVNDAVYMAESRRTGADGPAKAVINLRAGTLKAQAVGIYPTSVRDSAKAYVNLDGGTYVPTSPSPFGSVGGYPSLPTRVTVCEGGLVISNTSSAKIHAPLLAPYGNSVKAVPVPEALASRTFVAPPFVEIFEADAEGAGDGATACAFLDPANGRLARIEVTSPGWGYTRAVARFNMGPAVLATVDCTLGASGSGGLVKLGGQTLSLAAANAYGGDTVVKAGTLKLEHEQALPATTRLRVEGGTLDLGGFAPTVAGAFVSEGAAVVNGTLTLGSFTFDVTAPETMTSPVAVAFAEGATLTIAHAAALANLEQTLVIARFPAGWTGTRPDVEGLEGAALAPWRVAFGPTAIKLMRARGTAVIFR